MRHPTRDAFDALTPEALHETARTLCRALPNGWSIHDLVTGGPDWPARLLLAFGDSTFAYLPGGEARIGFDAACWRPSAAERASWAWSVAEWGCEGSIEAHVERSTSRERDVTVASFLCETRASLRGFERLPADGEEARAVLSRTAPTVAQLTIADTIYRFEPAADGSRTVWRREPMEHAALCAAFAADGFRLPSAEEWEYACTGGARTLYPWGDHAPADRDPIGKPPAADADERDPDFPPDWDAHRRPNRWGIQAPHDPYKVERVAEPGLIRGGDGGGMVCGGAGFFLGWLTLAPSWFEAELCQGLADDGWADAEGISRRVFPLD